ncbi:uncharacterized protein LOC143283536 [Babylonia areolata]|uniref:uncharacterized protein LOC143283536 n=1 Tax=Babylonia areolata TaxID=304850 RepID=UPI003FD49210
MQKLIDLSQSMWNEGQIPQHQKYASTVHIYKRKGNRQSCDNHRGISVMSIAGKILARVLLNRLLQHLEQGKMPGATQRPLHDLCRYGQQRRLWKIMEKFGCPSKFITIVRQFHDSMMVKVLDDGDESEAFRRATTSDSASATKLMVYCAMVFTTLLHASETWTV